jgi:LysM repeat protein
MKKQWTATALVMALGLAAPVLAQDDPMPPQDDPSQPTMPAPDDSGRTAPTQTPPATPPPVDESKSADREQAAQPASAIAGEEYVVQKGDTLSNIAERTLGSAGQWKQIADANNLSNPNMISVGQKLNIPQGSNAEPAAKTFEEKSNPDERSGYDH